MHGSSIDGKYQMVKSNRAIVHSVIFPRFFSDKQSDRQTDRKTNIVVYRKVTLHKKNCKYLINIKIRSSTIYSIHLKKMSVSTNAQTGFTEGLSSGYCTSRYVLVDLKRMLIVGQMTQGRHKNNILEAQLSFKNWVLFCTILMKWETFISFCQKTNQ